MNLLIFPLFDYDADKTNAGPGWNKWVGRLENLLVGMSINNDGRKRAFLLHYAASMMQKKVHLMKHMTLQRLFLLTI